MLYLNKKISNYLHLTSNIYKVNAANEKKIQILFLLKLSYSWFWSKIPYLKVYNAVYIKKSSLKHYSFTRPVNRTLIQPCKLKTTGRLSMGPKPRVADVPTDTRLLKRAGGPPPPTPLIYAFVPFLCEYAKNSFSLLLTILSPEKTVSLLQFGFSASIDCFSRALPGLCIMEKSLRRIVCQTWTWLPNRIKKSFE